MIKFLDLKQINERFLNEMDAVVKRVLDSGWHLLGKECEAFEREFVARYCRKIANPAIALPSAIECNRRLSNVWRVFPVRTERRDEFQRCLTAKGIQTVIRCPIPLHRQPAYDMVGSFNIVNT